MVQMYTVLGRQIGSHWLAIATLTTLGAVTTISMGGSKVKKADGPPINAKSPDEEKFIMDFLKQAEAEEKKGEKAHAK